MIAMQLLALIIIMLLLSVMLGIGVGTIVVYHRDQRASESRYLSANAELSMPQQWYIELWDTRVGARYTAYFAGGITLGRSTPGRRANGFLPVGEDVTISHEQCVIYAQGNRLYIWNLGKVNCTQLNGAPVLQPEELHRGDRITMGGRIFLLTMLTWGWVDQTV